MNRYQSLHSFVYEYGSSLVDLADPRAGERILDVGCGSGELTNALYEHAKQNNHHCEQSETSGGVVIGVDLDINMIQKAQEQYPHLHFAQADARNLDLASLVHGQDEPGAAVSDDPRVDLLFSNAALHWIPPKDAPKAVAAMAKALKPGGRFVVEFGGVGNVQQIAQACQDATGVQAIDFWYFPSIPEFSALLQANGIEVTSAVLFDRPTQLEEGDAGLSNWIRMFGNKFLDNLSSEEEVDDALKKINDKLKATMWDGTTWTADYRRIRIAGRKLISKTRN